MLIGIVLDDMLGTRPLAKGWSLVVYVAGMLAGVGLMTYGIARTQAGTFVGTRPEKHLGSWLESLKVSLTGP